MGMRDFRSKLMKGHDPKRECAVTKRKKQKTK